MTTGLVLIAAILILGGVIATVGDRLGTRVGKARLTLFNLRPRKTATLITILTGGIIAASTFGILFAVSDNLRTGVFDLERIRRERQVAEEERDKAKAEREQIERRLQTARRKQEAARKRLATINEFLQAANDRQARTAAQLDQAQARLATVQARFQQAQDRFQQAQTFLQTVSSQLATLRTELQQLQAGRQDLIRQRDQVRVQIAERDQEILARDQAIAQRETQLLALASQRSELEKEVQDLQGIRDGSVTLFRNQVLASSPPFKVVDPTAAPQLVNQVLLQANRFALQRIRPDLPNLNRQVIRIPNSEVEPVIKQIQDGQEYVIRILSARNYAVGQPCVLAGDACIEVRAIAIHNQLVFPRGGIVASAPVDPTSLTSEALAELILRVIAAAQFRARQAGILPEQVVIADDRSEIVVKFFKEVEEYNQPLEIQVAAAENSYTAGISRLELVAVQNGQVLFSTQPVSP
ncbi:MAG: DUF3084 domain-containing protein [Timaviella obliquedivisa GSE-PSE-MK23-08B]|jgi:uncharacterized protein (DUF3084 family)|nr:DUF3084 domain-containing protein [Timaviella obliquedivisa GSE-PSE-MK23-08B]